MTTPIVLPWPLQSGLEAAARALLQSGGRSNIDFSRPIGEAALTSPHSMSWRVCKNPVSLFIGGLHDVIAGTTPSGEPYGVARTIDCHQGGAPCPAQPQDRIHTESRVLPNAINDPELLTWVQGTAAYGFLQAYHSYVQPLSLSDRDRYYAESVPAAGLYGATAAPTSEAELEKLFHATASRLERSDIVFEFPCDDAPRAYSANAAAARAAPFGTSRR